MIETTLDTLLVGKPKKFRDDGELSAIVKQPVTGRLKLDHFGLEGNQVADPLHHGGRDKAVHLYPQEHYSFWEEKYPDLDILDQPGAFGENFSCEGLTEDQLCLGDVFQIGEAVIQCSHARQPCWKLNHHFDRKDVMKTVIQTTKSGSYFRVLEPGLVGSGDRIVQLENPKPDWPLDKLFALIIGGAHKGRREELNMLANDPVLAETWRKRAAQLTD